MEHGMVNPGGPPPFAAALLYITFGLAVICVILLLQRRGRHD